MARAHQVAPRKRNAKPRKSAKPRRSAEPRKSAKPQGSGKSKSGAKPQKRRARKAPTAKPRAARALRSADGDLAVYWQRRDFSQTPEPSGADLGRPRSAPRRSRGHNRAAQAAAQRRAFVVQRHDARRLHYDFRLEHAGVLKSWAVTKEPKPIAKEKRLAVQTEDHPLDYGKFEGEIPSGHYGAGSVVIWDRGHWTPEGDVASGLENGKLNFELHGERLQGRWTLVRMGRKDSARKGPDNWLLIKRTDEAKAAPPARATRMRTGTPRSRATRTRTATPRTPKSKPDDALERLAATAGVRRAPLPAQLTPQLATLVAAPVTGADWLHEPKLDGYRLLCRVAGGRAELITRRGNDWTDRFAAIADAAAALPCAAAVIDGEAVVFDAHGATSFQRLQNAIGRDGAGIVLVAFDLLHLDGYDLRDVALRARKELLRELLARSDGTIRYGEHFTGDGAAFLREACRLGLEGIVSKRADDPYRETRTRSWLKVKCLARQELVIVGYTDPQGSRTGFGALLLGVREAPGEPLRFAGKVGTGFDEATLAMLHARLAPLQRRDAPVDASSAKRAGRRGVHWVEPELVAEIAFGEWTDDGRLRHPRFLGLREDKTAGEIYRERPVATPAAQGGSGAMARLTHGAKRKAKHNAKRAAKPAARPTAKPAAKRNAKPPAKRNAKPPAKQEDPQTLERVRLTSPDKILFPDPGITKRELAEYWASVAPVALPQLLHRPLTLYRCPEGYGAQCFYQKHVGAGVPRTVARVTIAADEEPYAMVDGLAALLSLVQIGVLEVHAWGSRAEHLDQPDVIVFDLDPAEDLPWPAVIDAAHDLRERLDALGLVPFARLTGGKGLHVVVPVEPGPTWPAVKRFTRAVVDDMVRSSPRKYTASVSKAQRTGKIFIDYLRNDREATAIASYSPRARAGAPVALPVAWDDLERPAKAPRFLLRDVPALVASRQDPWSGFDDSRRGLA